MPWENLKNLDQEILAKMKNWIKHVPINLISNLTPYKFAKDIGIDINEGTDFLHSLYRYGFAKVKINVECPDCSTPNMIYINDNIDKVECIECENTIEEEFIMNGELIYILNDEYFKEKSSNKKILDPMNLLRKDKSEIFTKSNNIIKMEDYGETMVEEIKKPKIFIGSTVEKIKLANTLQELLEFDTEPTVWTQGIFKLSSSTIDDLRESIKKMDAAIFLYTPDDIAEIRNDVVSVVRDNIIFELGLAIGILGKNKVFYIIPRNSEIHIPTDLIGLSPGTYDAKRDDGNMRAALSPVVNKIIDQLKEN